MKFNKYLSILMVIVLSLSIFGCKRKAPTEEIEPTVMYTEDEYLAVTQQLNQLKQELSLYDNKYQTQMAFKTKDVLQAGNWKFQKVNDKIVLDKAPWDYADGFAQPAGLQGTIKMGNEVSIKTPDNWKLQIKTDNVECNIPNNVYGSLYFINLGGGLPEDTKAMLSSYFQTNDLKPIYQDKEIFVNNSLCGYENSVTVEINDSTLNGQSFSIPAYQLMDISEILNYDNDTEIDVTIETDENTIKTATLRVGILCYRDICLTYKFLEMNTSGTRNALDLIQNIYINNNNVYVK